MQLIKNDTQPNDVSDVIQKQKNSFYLSLKSYQIKLQHY